MLSTRAYVLSVALTLALGGCRGGGDDVAPATAPSRGLRSRRGRRVPSRGRRCRPGRRRPPRPRRRRPPHGVARGPILRPRGEVLRHHGSDRDLRRGERTAHERQLPAGNASDRARPTSTATPAHGPTGPPGHHDPLHQGRCDGPLQPRHAPGSGPARVTEQRPRPRPGEDRRCVREDGRLGRDHGDERRLPRSPGRSQDQHGPAHERETAGRPSGSTATSGARASTRARPRTRRCGASTAMRATTPRT